MPDTIVTRESIALSAAQVLLEHGPDAAERNPHPLGSMLFGAWDKEFKRAAKAEAAECLHEERAYWQRQEIETLEA